VTGVRGLAALIALAGAGLLATVGQAPAQSSTDNPLAGLTFYNDPESPSMLEWRHLTRTGQRAKADLIWKIAREPKAVWVGRFTRPNFYVKVHRIFDAAQGASGW
jgi:hypothetical protein